MNKKTVEVLEYNRIKEELKHFAISEIAMEMVDKLEPALDQKVIERMMQETSEARAIINITSSIPIHSLKGIKQVKEKLQKGFVLSPEDLESIAGLLREGKRLKRFMEEKAYHAPTISLYAQSIYELNEAREEIERCIVRNHVDDRASSTLQKIRKKIYILEERIKSKLEGVLRNEAYKGYMQDSLVSQRNGRYVIPVKSEYRKQIEGDIHDKSQSGSTVFVEPAGVKKAQDELNIQRIEEEKEVYRILSYLTERVFQAERELNINIEAMSYYDFLFAKGKYSKSIEGRGVAFNHKNHICIRQGKHPLIGKSAVPLDFSIGENYRAIVITGPNTGGKTVALKTVGLLTMMAQSGLHVPVKEGSQFGIFADILVDIGDGQSIEQSLSTFSAHVKNLIDILHCADPHTLVIVDEIGAGTDPGEGMGLAVSILQELYDKGATLCATTHYSEIKYFAENHPGFVNGSMAFDIETLKPLYKLNIGKAGESNAFLIALRLGMNRSIIERAHQITYKEEQDYSTYEKQEREKAASREAIETHKEQKAKLRQAEKRMKMAEEIQREAIFNIGDCVFISYMKRTGIICELENAKGEYGVMVMEKKLRINKKRLSLYIDKKELYPEAYDFDIVFKSKDHRKKEKIMQKRHEEGIQVEIEKL